VKRSDRDKPMWIAINMCMEAMLGISLYSYLYNKVAKMLSFLLLLMFSLQQNQRTEVGSEDGGRSGGKGGPNNVYACG
jgi:uncharacterized membrane protein YhaH (DUF805 family)